MSEEVSSGFRVPLTKIKYLKDHENAHSLSIAKVYGWEVVVRKDFYQPDQSVIYVPMDAILYNQAITDCIFPPDSKIKLRDRRVRIIKIRGVYSQGLIIDPKSLESVFGPNWWVNIELETDLSAMLEIIKYEPPSYKQKGLQPKRERNKANENPRFHKYNGLTHLRWVPDWFTSDENVVVQEKIHGSSARASIQPTAVNNKWRKLLKFVNLLPKQEYCIGSNNVQLQQKNNYTGYYGENVYAQAFENCQAFKKLKLGETIFGELVCEGIQNNYHYGHKKPHFILFDVKVTLDTGEQVYLDPQKVEDFAKERGFDMVPILYKGIFDLDKIQTLVSGPSIYYPEHKVREGIVIKAYKDYDNNGQKKAVKLLNPDYLNEDNTDFK